jgi:hypothetical protein
MRTIKTRYEVPRYAFLAIVAMFLLASPVSAGHLDVSWPPAKDDLTAGYYVYVGTAPGQYDRVEDAGEEHRATIRDLEDGTVHYFAVKAYDAEGRESDSFSPELACLPSPRVDSVAPSVLQPGDTAVVSLHGANFTPDMQVRPQNEGLHVQGVIPAGPGQLLLVLYADENEPEGLDTVQGPVTLEPASFKLLASCRRSEEFFEAHPEAVDVDISGRVDGADLQIVQAAFGSMRGDENYRAVADLNGDGTVDGGDLARVIARQGTDARFRATPPAEGSSEDANDEG